MGHVFFFDYLSAKRCAPNIYKVIIDRKSVTYVFNHTRFLSFYRNETAPKLQYASKYRNIIP